MEPRFSMEPAQLLVLGQVQTALDGIAFWVLLLAAAGLCLGAGAWAAGSLAGHSNLRSWGVQLVTAALLGAICVGAVTVWVAWATGT